jgi:hypothetical protein
VHQANQKFNSAPINDGTNVLIVVSGKQPKFAEFRHFALERVVKKYVFRVRVNSAGFVSIQASVQVASVKSSGQITHRTRNGIVYLSPPPGCGSRNSILKPLPVFFFPPQLKLYQLVIEDVVTNVREAFLDEGVDEQVLQEMKQIWTNRLMASKAVDVLPEPLAPQSQPAILANNPKVSHGRVLTCICHAAIFFLNYTLNLRRLDSQRYLLGGNLHANRPNTRTPRLIFPANPFRQTEQSRRKPSQPNRRATRRR